MKMKDFRSRGETKASINYLDCIGTNSNPKCFGTKAGDHNGAGKRPAAPDNHTKKLCNTESA